MLFVSLTLTQSFYNRAFGKVQKVSEKYRKMDEKYTAVCQMFGEDGKKIEPSDFFKYFQDFVTMYFVSISNDWKLLYSNPNENWWDSSKFYPSFVGS